MGAIHQAFLRYKPELEASLGEGVMISGLTGPLRIFQRINGHRHSIDDATTSWYALKKCPAATKVLDLGTGIGTVGLALLWGLGGAATLTCVEAQEISFKLLTANIRCNGLETRVRAIHGDLRELNLTEKFSLVTGSPPYFPLQAGTLPKDPQKAHARFELRGDVGDYAAAAKRHLAAGGTFVFCFPNQHTDRGLRRVEEQGFGIVSSRTVVPHPGKRPLFTLYRAMPDFAGETAVEPALLVRDSSGNHTADMREVQESRGFGPDGTNILGAV